MENDGNDVPDLSAGGGQRQQQPAGTVGQYQQQQQAAGSGRAFPGMGMPPPPSWLPPAGGYLPIHFAAAARMGQNFQSAGPYGHPGMMPMQQRQMMAAGPAAGQFGMPSSGAHHQMPPAAAGQPQQFGPMGVGGPMGFHYNVPGILPVPAQPPPAMMVLPPGQQQHGTPQGLTPQQQQQAYYAQQHPPQQQQASPPPPVEAPPPAVRSVQMPLPIRESDPLATNTFDNVQRHILREVRFGLHLRLGSLSKQRMTDDMREEKVAKLSQELRERFIIKKQKLEISYRHDCENYGLVTRKLIEQDRSLEDRLKVALLETMKKLEGETIKELDEYLDQLHLIATQITLD